MKHIEVVVPCYNEQECVRPLYEEVNRVLGKMEDYTFSVLYVDDGSTDRTLEEIHMLEQEIGSQRIHYISLSRNFGKESALYAGLSRAQGTYIAVMDVDLQHPPELLTQMLDAIEKDGFDGVGARRISRKGEPFVKSLLSKAFYHVINWVTGMHLVPGMTDYRLMRLSMAEAIVAMPERERFTKGLYSWIGFNTKLIDYVNVERAKGTSKWTVKGLWNYAKSGFIAFTVAPMRGIVYLGMIVVLLSLIYGIRVYWDAMSGVRPWQDTTTIILLMLFFGGVIITTLGIIGEYLARIYTESKGRPIFIEKETNLKKDV